MLGQLHMDIDDCITMYSRLWGAMHHPERQETQVVAERDSAKLRLAVRSVIEEHGRSGTEAFTAAADHGCRVLVLVLVSQCLRPRLTRCSTKNSMRRRRR